MYTIQLIYSKREFYTKIIKTLPVMSRIEILMPVYVNTRQRSRQ